MSQLSRRKLITGGIATAAGLTGIAAAGRFAQNHGLIPPDWSGIYGPGETLTYAVQRVLGANAHARTFPRSMISAAPFANEVAPLGDVFHRSQAAGFADWKLTVDGLVAHPTTFSLSDLRSMPTQSQITEVACEEGWSYIAEWIGTPLHGLLREVGAMPQARYVAYFSFQRDWWESIDMPAALHPQTFLTLGMNNGDLPVAFGGPLRMRVPRQLGYKNIKYVTRLTVTDSMKHFGKGLGSSSPEAGYAWYGGI